MGRFYNPSTSVLQFYSLLLCVMFLIGCSEQNQIKDLQKPQDAMLFLKENLEFQDPLILARLKGEYLQKFFAPLKDLEPNQNAEEVFWIQGSLQKYPGYGENLKPNSLSYTQDILKRMQLESYPSVAQKAIVVRDTNVRAVPTLKPRFSRSNGYPFDRWQNSSIFYGTPVLITHYDQSKRFAHIQTEFVYGWVEITDLAILNQKQIKTLLGVKNFVMPNEDLYVIEDSAHRFLTQARVGKLFMLDNENQMLVFKRKDSGELHIERAKFDSQKFHAFPQFFSQEKVAKYINTLMGQKYGWGGMYESRDCSSFIRDIFANFGLYLPRNSLAQLKYGTHQIDLKSDTPKQKAEIILKSATPFATLLWFKGHIMLYIGMDENGDPMVAHSAWSVQTKNFYGKREYLLGGVVITTLHPASEHNGILFKSPTLQDRVQMMNNLLPYFKDQ